jgi:ubiquinone/menaquinone biosynthesis C-methylase UbiE
LEIGGDPPFGVAMEFMARGAKRVVTIDYRKDMADAQVAENIEFRNMDARDLKFDNDEFDIVFGVAVLEHLPNLDTVLDEAERVLVKDGYLYLHGGSLWSSNLGHHVWVEADGMSYFFNANNPIPDWCHLLYQKDEMKTYLEAQHIIPAHAQNIVDMVYDNPILNRYSYEDYIRFLHNSTMAIRTIKETSWRSPSGEMLAKLRAMDRANSKSILERLMGFLKDKDHSTGEIEAILRKR